MISSTKIAIVINPVLNSCEKHTASLEEEVKVIKANFQNAECITLVRLKHLHPVANSLIFDLQRDTNAIVSIRIRKPIDRAPYCSVCWTLSQERQMTHISRTYHFCYVPNSSVFGTPDIISGHAGTTVSRQTVRELSSPIKYRIFWVSGSPRTSSIWSSRQDG